MYVGLGAYGKTISAQERFDDPHVRDNRMRDWQERLDTRNQGLPVTLGQPVARLSRWRTFSAFC